MASIYDLKPAFQAKLRPVVQRLATAGITANQVTLAALMLSAIVGALLYFPGWGRWVYLLVPFALFARMALNAIDGMLAREHNMKSKLGAVLNELGDVLSDTFLYTPFILLAMKWGVVALLVVPLCIVSEMAGVVAVQIGAQRRYDGPMGKSDRAAAFGVMALLIGLGTGVEKIIHWFFLALVLALGYTIYRRCINALREAGEASKA